ncbi:MAG: enoyl-CoA hydratase/isomerase family protein [Acidimicrobiia bacterium]|nr:enoyl-CoA hydratase/isomerase family protein [Acidimicrobiia bacterium]
MGTDGSVDGLMVAESGGALRLTLNRPEARNAVDDVTLAALVEQVEAARRRGDLRVILVSSVGEHFCAGIDLSGAEARRDRAARVGHIQRSLHSGAHRLTLALSEVQLPVVAAVRGWCAGLGLHLALAADLVVASRTARFWEPFTTRGFTPDGGGTWMLPRLVGVARAKEMLLLGRPVGADEAAEWGMIHEAVDDAELEPAAEALVARLADAATVAVGLTKWLVNRSLEVDLADALAHEAFVEELALRSPDFKEGIAALRERRPPRFEGR